MAINQSNTDKGANGGPMPIQSPNDGASEWSRKSPQNEWQGGRKAAGPEVSSTRPTGDAPGNPSKTPRP